jgi:hypothetical protein
MPIRLYRETRRNEMPKNAKLSLLLGTALGLTLCPAIVAGGGRASAQDIAGVEDCTKTSGLDKRTGCMQSNVNFLQQLITKNALDARARLTAAGNEIAALKNEVATLKAALASLQATVEQLKAAPKPPDSKDKAAPTK